MFSTSSSDDEHSLCFCRLTTSVLFEAAHGDRFAEAA